MDLLSKQNIGTAATVIAVLAFNVIMLVLLELPLIGYLISPESTAATVRRFNDLLTRDRGGCADRGEPDQHLADYARHPHPLNRDDVPAGI